MADRDDETTADEPFLARWSRRKREVPAEPEAAVEEAPRQLDPEPLPDPATLTADSDFKPFMRAGVPAGMRRDALRRLWRLNPTIGVHDGLDDCFLDFTDAATCAPNVRSLWRVGQGIAAASEELERRLQAAEEPKRLEEDHDEGTEACPRSGDVLT